MSLRVCDTYHGSGCSLDGGAALKIAERERFHALGLAAFSCPRRRGWSAGCLKRHAVAFIMKLVTAPPSLIVKGTRYACLAYTRHYCYARQLLSVSSHYDEIL